MASIEWIEPNGVHWLGQTPSSMALPDTAKLSVEEAKQEKRLGTQDKILIVSLFLSIATFAWTVYEWRNKK